MHIDADRLEAHLDGAPLTPAERGHLDNCALCQGDLDDATAVREMLRTHVEPTLHESVSFSMAAEPAARLNPMDMMSQRRAPRRDPASAFILGQEMWTSDAGGLLGALTIGPTELEFHRADEPYPARTMMRRRMVTRRDNDSSEFPGAGATGPRIQVTAGDLLLLFTLDTHTLSIAGRDRLSGAAVPLEATLTLPPGEPLISAADSKRVVTLPRPDRRGRLDVVDGDERWILQIATEDDRDF